jgi:multiple sugar transport system ATP-binding protein
VRVVRSETHGADRFVSCRLLSDETVAITLRQGAGDAVGADMNGVMNLGFAPERAHLFAADGLRRKVTVRERVPA